MTKEEAIKFLINTKVYVDGKSKEIQEKLFRLGFKWAGGETIVFACNKPFLFISREMNISHSACMEHFKNAGGREIKVDEILSIEIEKECIFKPFDKVLVRDDSDDEWRAGIFSHIDTKDSRYPFVTSHSIYKYCIPYKGNEDLIGTTKSSKR